MSACGLTEGKGYMAGEREVIHGATSPKGGSTGMWKYRGGVADYLDTFNGDCFQKIPSTSCSLLSRLAPFFSISS